MVEIEESKIVEIIDCIQGSDEWYQARLGMVTTSNFSKVLNKKTGRGLYMRKLAAERLTGLREESYKNDTIDAGSELEDEARRFYEMANDCEVKQVGFVKRDEDIGGSPDGLVGDEGTIEIKCPLSSTHIENIINDSMPTVYIPQVQGLLLVTERKWCDFISYDPRVVSQPMFCKRIELDRQYVITLAAELGIFVGQLKEMVKKIDDGSF